MDKALLVMVLAHRRPELLQRTLRFWQEFPNAHILLCPDRPTPEVQDVVAACDGALVVHGTGPVMSVAGGQRWTHVRNECLAAFDTAGFTAAWEVNGDDDRWFDPEAVDWILEAMRNPATWCLRAVSLFHWNAAGDVNVRQIHDEPLFGRYHKGWRRDPHFHGQVATEVLQHVAGVPESSVYVPFYLHDWGTSDPVERERAFREYANAGKLSNYTRRYVQPPVLMTVDEIHQKFQRPQDFSVWQHVKYSPYED